MSQGLLGSEIPFGGQDGGVAQQQLDLLQIASRLAAELGAGSAEVVNRLGGPTGLRQSSRRFAEDRAVRVCLAVVQERREAIWRLVVGYARETEKMPALTRKSGSAQRSVGPTSSSSCGSTRR